MTDGRGLVLADHALVEHLSSLPEEDAREAYRTLLASLHKARPLDSSPVMAPEAVRQFDELDQDSKRELLWRSYPRIVGKTYRRRMGQFFTQENIVRLALRALTPHTGEVLDPTMGHGLFLHLANELCDQADLTGVELDPLPLSAARLILPEHVELHRADFTAWALDALREGRRFEAIVGNPPYVGYQQLDELADDDNYRSILLDRLEQASELADAPKAYERLISSLSGFSDLSMYILVLSWTLLRDRGILSMVVANYWLERDYGKAVLEFLSKTGRVREIYLDIRRTWFPEAQVPTSIIVYKKAAETGKPAVHLTHLRTDGELAIEHMATSEGNIDSRLPRHVAHVLEEDDGTAPTLPEMGWEVRQGLRTGCNQFFYVYRADQGSVEARLKRDGSFERFRFQAPADVLRPAVFRLPGDADLSVGVDEADAYLLDLNGYLTRRDMAKVRAEYDSSRAFDFKLVPESLDHFIETARDWTYEASGTSGTRIPELSAVAPNEKCPAKGKDVRPSMWYHLPLSRRHYGHIIIPRVSSGPVRAYKLSAPGRIITDANFISLIPRTQTDFDSLPLTTLWLILNSNWFRLWAEKSGVVMGGGALKLEASTLRTLTMPGSLCLDTDGKLDLAGDPPEVEIAGASILDLGERIDRVVFGEDEAAMVRSRVERAIERRST